MRALLLRCRGWLSRPDDLSADRKYVSDCLRDLGRLPAGLAEFSRGVLGDVKFRQYAGASGGYFLALGGEALPGAVRQAVRSARLWKWQERRLWSELALEFRRLEEEAA